MIFEWDENKNRINQKRHGVSFDAAKLVFFDPCSVTTFDRVEDGEERWHTLGCVNGVVLLLVVHTARDKDNIEIIRIISARRTTSHERKCYDNR